MQEAAVQYPEFVTSSKDPYSCYHFALTRPTPEAQFCDFIAQFTQHQIESNLARHPSQITKAIWIKLSPPHLGFVAALHSLGFLIHSGAQDTITLCRWIALRKNLVPPYSLFYVGCGAAVIVGGRILLLQESNGVRKGKWGLPSGRADPGETINLCAERELFEETNLRGKFRGILHFREMTQSVYDCVDVYFVCLLDVQQAQLESLKLCEVEISDHKWVELSEYYQFIKQRGSRTQQMVAEYITRLHKSGFDFSKAPLNRSVFQSEDVGEGRPKKLSAYHELVPIPNQTSSIPQL